MNVKRPSCNSNQLKGIKAKQIEEAHLSSINLVHDIVHIAKQHCSMPEGLVDYYTNRLRTAATGSNKNVNITFTKRRELCDAAKRVLHYIDTQMNDERREAFFRAFAEVKAAVLQSLRDGECA